MAEAAAIPYFWMDLAMSLPWQMSPIWQAVSATMR